MNMVPSKVRKILMWVTFSVGLIVGLFEMSFAVGGDNTGCDEQSKTAATKNDYCYAAAKPCGRQKTSSQTVTYALKVDTAFKVVVVAVTAGATVTGSYTIENYECTVNNDAYGTCKYKVGVDWGSASGTVAKIRAQDCYRDSNATKAIFDCNTADVEDEYAVPTPIINSLLAAVPGAILPDGGLKIPFTRKDCVATQRLNAAGQPVTFPCSGEFKSVDGTCFQP